MTDINLLPWREEKVKFSNRIFGFIAGAVVLGCIAVCFIVYLGLEGLVGYETKEVAILRKEINMLESKIVAIKGLQERQDLLLSKRNLIQALQASRPFIVKLFEDVTLAVPEGVFLSTMIRQDNKLILEGISNSNSRISVFMLNLEQLKWLSNATLQEIKTEENRMDKQITTKIVGQSFGNGATMNKQIVFKLQGDING